MKPLMDVVALHMAKVIALYRLGGVIGLLLGVTASVFMLRTRPRTRLLASDAGSSGRLRR